jgi:hypothetical protein
LDLEVLHQGFGPRDRRLERLDAHVLLGADLVEAERLEGGDAELDVGIDGRRWNALDGGKALVDGGVAGGAARLPIREAALPLRVLVVESAVELFLRLLDLVQKELGVRIHGAESSLTASVVAMRRIGG